MIDARERLIPLSLRFRASTAQAHASYLMQRKEIPSTQCRISPHCETRLQASSPQQTSSSNLSGNQYWAYICAQSRIISSLGCDGCAQNWGNVCDLASFRDRPLGWRPLPRRSTPRSLTRATVDVLTFVLARQFL